MSSSTEKLTRLMRRGKSVILVGPPGCGKTGRIVEIAQSLGMDVELSRASMAERTDYSGCYVPDTEKGVTRALPLDMLHRLRTTTKKTLFFLDDFGQAPEDVQSASMSFWDKVDGLPDNVLIWAATNRATDRAGVRRMHEALRSRFQHAFVIPTPDTIDANPAHVLLGTWQDELDGWVDWALNYGAPAEVIAWIRSAGMRKNEDNVNGTPKSRNPLYSWRPDSDPAMRFPDFRNWQSVIDDWNDGERDFDVFASTIGKPAAAEFLQFARLADQLPTPDQVFIDPRGTIIPTDSSALYLIVSMLTAATEPKNADAAVIYMSRIAKEVDSGRVFSALMARDLLKKHGSRLTGSREWNSWFQANRELFEVN